MQPADFAEEGCWPRTSVPSYGFSIQARKDIWYEGEEPELDGELKDLVASGRPHKGCGGERMSPRSLSS